MLGGGLGTGFLARSNGQMATGVGEAFGHVAAQIASPADYHGNLAGQVEKFCAHGDAPGAGQYRRLKVGDQPDEGS